MTPILTALVALAAVTVGFVPLGAPPRGRALGRRGPGPLERAGAAAAPRLGRWLPSIAMIGHRAVGATLVTAPMLALVAPPLAAVPLVVAGGVAIGRTRARRLADLHSLERGMVQLVDLLALAVAAGLPLRAAFRAAARQLPGLHRRLIDTLLVRVEQGEPFASALRWYGSRLGAAGADLTTVLIAAERDGAPLVAGLERAADTARRARRRELERRARRLPVTMLLPLVLCVLPAFVVLTVVPLLVGTLGDLRLPG